MIYIYHTTKYEDVYFFTTPEWFSSDFDSLEQLAEVGLDDPDKIALSHLFYQGKPYPQDVTLLEDIYSDCQLLVKLNSFEEIYDYPELLI